MTPLQSLFSGLLTLLAWGLFAPASLGAQTAEAWREDLSFFAHTFETQHADLFRSVPEDVWREQVAALHDDIPHLARHEILVRLFELVGLLPDGHSHLDAYGEAGGLRLFPLTVQRFASAWFVAAAAPPNEHTVGMRVVAVDGMPIEAVYDAVVPTLNADNESFRRWSVPNRLTTPEVLSARGVLEDMEHARYTLEDAEGTRTDVVLTPEAGPEVRGYARAHLRHPWRHPAFPAGTPYDFTLLEESGTLLVFFDTVVDAPDGETIAQFVKRLKRFVRRNDFERLVLDMRGNGGGSTNNAIPLVKLLSTEARINRAGRLFVLTGPNTYSAAVLTTALIENRTKALFVGEPAGQGPNLLGDPIVRELPNSGLTLRVSNHFWQSSHLDDPRETFTPDLPVPLTHADSVAGHDACLEAVLAYEHGLPVLTPLDERSAQRYVGRYAFAPCQTLEVALDDDALSYTLVDHISGPGWLLHAESDLHPVERGFLTDTRGVTLERAPGDGPVQELVVHWQGVRVVCPRVPREFHSLVERIDGGNIAEHERGPSIPRDADDRIRGTTAKDARDACAVLLAQRDTLRGNDILEQRLNTAGYSWLRHGEPETARVVFETNTVLYPRSWNTWDSLGECLAELGRRDEAIAHYEHSLALNPENEGGRRMLLTLQRKAP